MGYNTTYTEYHLTPRGWIVGAWDVDKPPENPSLPPEDRIETWRLKETSHDTYPSNPTRDWEPIWVSTDWPKEKRNQIRKQIGDQLAEESQGTRKFFLYFPREYP